MGTQTLTSIVRLICRLLVDNRKAVCEVAVAWDIFNADLLIVVEGTNNIASPNVSDLHLLGGAGHNTNVFEVKDELGVRNLMPVDD